MTSPGNGAVKTVDCGDFDGDDDGDGFCSVDSEVVASVVVLPVL